MNVKGRMTKIWLKKNIREQGIKTTDSIKTLCNFMKNVSQEWDIEESKDLTYWYIDQYYQRMEEENNDDSSSSPSESLQEKYNHTLIHSLSLWNDFHFLCPLIHDFNMRTLAKVDDTTIGLILPQLLITCKNTRDSGLLEKILERCQRDLSNIIKLFWCLVVEVEKDTIMDMKEMIKPKEKETGRIKGGSGNIKGGGGNIKGGNFNSQERFYAKMAYDFMTRLNASSRNVKDILIKQGLLVERLVSLSGTLRQSRVSIAEKRKMLRKEINESGDLLLFDPIPLPIKNDVLVIGIVPEQCSVFQSQLNPMLLSFLTKDGKIIKCIFKSGDDLRQDAIMCEILHIVCMILKSNGVKPDDIVTYEVVSTGLTHGFVEFVSSNCLDNIFQDKRGLKTILEKEDGKLDDEKMTRFVNSTAYYTIVTYLMCIGDRHLDNILLTQDGRLFHIDYGFIGREPKPFAPAVKLCPEIIEIMGGKNSGYYVTFMKRCLSCFLILRKNAHVILDILELMLDAGINDINQTTIAKIKTRFALDVSDKEAITTLTSDIEKGFENVLPKMMDNFHHTWKVVSAGGLLKKEINDENETIIIKDIDLEDWAFLEDFEEELVEILEVP